MFSTALTDVPLNKPPHAFHNHSLTRFTKLGKSPLYECVFNLSSAFDGQLGWKRPADAIVTRVLTITYQVATCEHPPVELRAQLYGRPITLAANHTLMKSKAVYTRPEPVAIKHTFCACLLMWYRAEFLLEWLWYHTVVHGLGKVFLYDNDSGLDRLSDEAKRLAEHFNVEYIPWHTHKIQPAYHGHCALKAGTQCEWASFIDIDEFVYMPRHGRLATFLKDQKAKTGGIEARMITMSSGDVHKVYKPSGGVLRSYSCAGKSTNWKSIVRPYALHQSLVNAVHYYGYQYPPYTAKRMYGKTGNVETGDVRLYHYKNQAWEVFMRKYIRRASPATKRFRLDGGAQIPLPHKPDASWTKLMHTECHTRNVTHVYDDAQCALSPKACPPLGPAAAAAGPLIVGLGGMGSGLRWMRAMLKKHGVDAKVADWVQVRRDMGNWKSGPQYAQVIHHVRHPLAAIAAAIPVTADPTDAEYLSTHVKPALREWVLENQLLQLVADWRYRVEDVNLQDFCRQLLSGKVAAAGDKSCDALPAFKPRTGFRDSSAATSAHPLTWELLYAADEYVGKLAVGLARTYGYTAVEVVKEVSHIPSEKDPKWRDKIKY